MEDNFESLIVSSLGRIESNQTRLEEKLDSHIATEVRRDVSVLQRVTKLERDVRWHSKIVTACGAVVATIGTWIFYWFRSNRT